MTSVSLPTGPQILFLFVHCKQHVVPTFNYKIQIRPEEWQAEGWTEELPTERTLT